MTCVKGGRRKWLGLLTTAVTGLVVLNASAVTVQFNMEVSSPKTADKTFRIGTRPRLEDMDEKPAMMSKLYPLESLVKNTNPDSKDICLKISNLVRYAPDTEAGDEWRSAEETLKAGRGDCEDFAECVAATCQAKGLSATMYILRSNVNAQSHAVTIGEDNGGLWMSSNGNHQNVVSLSDAKEKVCKTMGWWYDDVTMTDAGSAVRPATASNYR